MSVFLLRLKLLLKDKTACICYIASSVVILAVILGLNLHSEERSSLPIGLVTEDGSPEAERLRDGIKSVEALYVYEGSFDELYELFLDGYINCIFTIGKEYGESIRAGETAELLEICAAEDDRISTVISDIVAGCMIYEICVNKAYNRYAALEEADVTESLMKAGYEEYVRKLSEDESFGFSFDVEYVDLNNKELNRNDISNAMIYRQMIAGMLAMLMMLVVFCACSGIASEYAKGTATRRKLTGTGGIRIALQEIAAVTVYSTVLALMISLAFSKSVDIKASAKLFGLNTILLLASAVLFVLLTAVLKNSFAYQLAGAAVVAILGVAGFISVFEGFMGTEIFENTPVALYISQFLKIVR